MSNREIEGKLKSAIEKSTPDIWDRVQCDISHGKGETVTMSDKKRKGKILGFVSGIAAALVLILAAVYGITNYSRADTKIVSTVAIEANSEIKLSLNTYNVVLKAEADNEDGKKVLEKINSEGVQLEDAVSSIVSSMVEQGYLRDNSNSMLISVENNDGAKARELHLEVLDNISSIMKAEKFEGSAVVQTVDTDKTLEEDAEKYGISAGKAEFIQFLGKNGVNKSLEELAALSVNDLNLIFEGLEDHDRFENSKYGYYGVSYSGKASDGKYIGVDKAKEIVLKAAGVEEKHLLYFEIDMDVENGVMVYEVELESDLKRYEYEINAVNGAVVSYNVLERENA